MVFGEFLLVLWVILSFLWQFLTFFGVSVVFYLGSCWSSWRKCVNCGFWRTSGRFSGSFVVDLWLLGVSFVFGCDPVLVWGVFDVFWGIRWVLLGSRLS